jgi:hypothetical protein
VLRSAGETETTQEIIEDWLQLDEGDPGFQLLTEEEIAAVTFFYFHQHYTESRDSSVGIATSGYGLDNRVVGVRVPVGPRIFTSRSRPDCLWGPPCLLLNGYWGIFLWG